jgi:hypothetical protein
LRQLVTAGRLGDKTGRGVFDLLVIAYPVVLVSVSPPSAETMHAAELRELYAGLAEGDPSGRPLEVTAREILDRIDNVVEPVNISLHQVRSTRLKNWDLDVRLDPRCAFDDAFPGVLPNESAEERAQIADANSACREHARRAIESLIDDGVFETLAELPSTAFAIPFTTDHPGVEPYLAAYSLLYEPSRWLLAAARLSAERGDWDRLDRFLSLHADISRVAARDPQPTSLSGAINFQRWRVDTVRRIATAPTPLPAPVLRGLLDHIESSPLDLPLETSAEIERLLLLDFGEVVHSDAGVRLPHNALMSYDGLVDSASPLNIPGLFAPRQHEYERAINDYHAKVTASLSLPEDQRRGTVDTGDLDRVADTGSQWSSMEIWMMLPWFLERLDAETTARNATLAVLAIELHCAEHGSLPTSLADLVGPYLAAPPFDAESSGGSFTYAIDPDSPTGYTLMSLTREWHREPERGP